MGKVYKPYTRKDFANDMQALKPIFFVSATISTLVACLVMSNDHDKRSNAEIAVVNDVKLEPVIIQAGVEFEIK